ncbi:MAG: hypothetical protein JO020_00460 [Chloroflexi bacterium]|nr:hypothetical protein [Chloroflexota bacterium]
MTGTASEVVMYIDQNTMTSQVQLGLYSDNAGHPGTLLTQGTLNTAIPGAWNTAQVPPVFVVAGTHYWIAALSPFGSADVNVRYHSVPANGGSEASSQTNLTALTTTWSTGSTSTKQDLSAYVLAAPLPVSPSTTYTYDLTGNRLSKVLMGQTTSYTSDKADRILTAGGANYTVNNAGNETARGSDTFSYDQVNRLTSATTGTGSGTYVYDGEGKRATKTVAGSTTNYIYDVGAGLSITLDDGTQKYIWGAGGLTYAVNKNSGAVQVYHTDGLGSVRELTDSAGNIVQTYQTDEFGIPTATQSTSGQPFGFTGEQRDPEDALIYLRARAYDPVLGRLLSRDPVGGAITNAATLNSYIYADDNPLSRADPSGLKSAVLGLPVLLIDSNRMPQKALHIELAQMALGYPDVLTRDNDQLRISQRRQSVCKPGQYAPLSCDEYPFASTEEGGSAMLSSLGRDASTFAIPLAEQRIEGGTISSFYRINHIQSGQKFRVIVVTGPDRVEPEPEPPDEQEPPILPIPRPVTLPVPA